LFRNAVSGIVLTVLLMSMLASMFNTQAVRASHSAVVYFDPPGYVFSASEVYVGYRFNATVRVSDVESLYAWQVYIWYDENLINVSRFFEPVWDPDYVFYEKPTIFMYAYDPWGLEGFACSSLLLGDQQPFSGSGKLVIIEFEILAVPPVGETYSSVLNINNEETILTDRYGNVFPAVKQDGYYEIRGPISTHDIAVDLNAPAFLEPGESTLLNATVYNKGLNNETNVELFILINGTEVSSAVIPELLTGASYTLSYLWTPAIEGTYNVTAYAPLVPGENITLNNARQILVSVKILPDILIVNDDDGGNWISGTSLTEFKSALTSAGYDYWVWNESSMGNPPLDFLLEFELVIWTCGDYWDWAVDSVDAETLEAYLTQGGNILLEGEDIGYNHDADNFMINVAHAIMQVDGTGAPGLTVTDPNHPVTFNLPPSFNWLTNPPYDDGVSPTNGGAEVIRYTGTTWTAVTVFEGNSSGSVVYYAFPFYCLPEPHRTTLAINSVNWLLGIRYEHELAVSLEAPSFLELGKTAILNATVHNYGSSNETNVEFQLLINSTIVNSVVIPELLTDSSYILSYSWTPTVEGIYNVTAYSPPVPGENITTNNIATKTIRVMAIKIYQLSHVPRRIHGDENYIYYTAQEGGTYRVNKVTGVEEFFCDKGHDLLWVEGDYVYVGEGYELGGSGTNDIYKYDKNGNLIWHVHPTYEGPWGGATFQFAVGKYYIYAVAGPYAYGAISKEDGSIVWVSEGGVTRYPDMAMADLKNEVLIECGWWSTNTIQRTSKVDGHIIWQRKGPTEEMGEVTQPVDITDDAVWVAWYKGTYPYQYFYALAKWDRETGALIEAFPDLPYSKIWHVGPEGSLIFSYPGEAGNALVWDYLAGKLCKVNTQTWEVYWSTDLGYPMEYCANRIFIDEEYIYLRDKTNPTLIYRYRWTTMPVVTATADISPKALNLRSKGKWITAYIELPEGYDVRDINVSTVMLNDTISAEPKPIAVGDYDEDGITDLMVKFDRAKVIQYILDNIDIVKLYEKKFMTITLTVTGKLYDGAPFQGTAIIRLIMPMPIGLRRHIFLI